MVELNGYAQREINIQSGRYGRLEGTDGSGKTTQMKLAEQYNEEKGIGAVFVREPGGTKFGAHIRALLLTDASMNLGPEVEFALFTADRRQLWDETILPALKEDRLVIGDRGVESTICYQSAGGGVSKDTILNVSNRLLDPRYMRPDTLAVLSISEEVRRRRLRARFTEEAADKIESRDDSYTHRVYKAYQALQELDYATIIDANRDPEDIFEDLKPVLFGKYLRDHTGIYLPTHTTHYVEQLVAPSQPDRQI
jgi:dTMP kinase